ncbi:MAG TPA: hypothetical protein VF297_05220 [Pyrinomonadaceae bacterium]
MTEEEARAEVEQKAQVSLEPALDEADVTAALNKARRFTAWEAESEVVYGARVVPTAANGHRYRAVQGGTTDEAEPSWGVTDYSRVADGGVIWEEDGPAGEMWDVRRAVYECLTTKLAKTSEYSGDEEQRIRAGILELMKLYRPIGIA